MKQRFLVTGFPTLLLITNGNIYEYEGSRSLMSLQKFALSEYVLGDRYRISEENWILNGFLFYSKLVEWSKVMLWLGIYNYGAVV